MLGFSLRALYPRRCPGCRGVMAPDMLICPDCEDQFRFIRPPFCLKCGRHVEEGSQYCDECSSKDHGYTFGISVFEYDDRMRRAMSDLKFHGWRENAGYFAEQAVLRYGKDIMDFAPQVLVPVPVHKSRLAERGYNQAAVITEEIGTRLGIATVNDLLIRVSKTKAQKTLGRENRSENLKKAFACDTGKYTEEKIKISFSRVMLIDDIYTTGATMEACTRALLGAGVQQVGILSIAAGGGY